MGVSDNKKLHDLITQELISLKDHQENVKDDFYLSQVEIDYLHFVDRFIKEYSKEEIMSVLNEMYNKEEITAIRNPQGLLFNIKLK